MEEKIIVPDLIEPITGWRFWKIFFDTNTLESENIFLESAVVKRLWPRREKMTAMCFCKPEHGIHPESPTIESQCGIHAYKSLKHVFADTKGLVGDGTMLSYYSGAILGRVRLWGKVQEHQFGYRAQFAYPCSFAIAICAGCFQPIFFDSEIFVLKTLRYMVRVQKGLTEILSEKIFCEKCRWNKSDISTDEAEFMGYRILNMLQDGYGVAIEENVLF